MRRTPGRVRILSIAPKLLQSISHSVCSHTVVYRCVLETLDLLEYNICRKYLPTVVSIPQGLDAFNSIPLDSQ